MKIVAHRGASGYAPENTAAALRQAVEFGVDMIEFDVHALPSGEVVLMHDHRLDRTTNGSGYLLDHSFTGLRALDAGSHERIPTLEEALDVIGRQTRANIELKGPGSAAPVSKILKRYLRSGWSPRDFLVSSFDHHGLRHFHELLPEIEIAALQDAIPLGYAAFAESLGATAVGPGHESVDRSYVEDAHRRGLEVLVWTINDAEEVRRMCDLGVDGIFTNYPDVARQTAAAYQARTADLRMP